MKKLLNKKTYIVIGGIVLCIALALLIRFFFVHKEVIASVTPLHVEEGEAIFFRDSTEGVKEWLWEFGNGDSSTEAEGFYIYQSLDFNNERDREYMHQLPNGEFIYPATRKYKIRLLVDRKHEKHFIVQVDRKKKKVEDMSHLIEICAPYVAMQGEYIVFKGKGEAKEWRWHFGETTGFDSYEQTALYKYEHPGEYEVQLMTNETQYPIIHYITIEEKYLPNDSTIESKLASQIKNWLQQIANQKPFAENYNPIIEHLCEEKHNTLVVINKEKKNDIYSYCHGLRLEGRKKKIIIDQVIIEKNPENPHCIQRLDVFQEIEY